MQVVGLTVGILMMLAATVPYGELPEYSRARETAQTVLASTRALLEKELSEKGPAGALKACATVALAEASKHEREGWRVRRVSLKLRNPADAPDAFEKAVLEDWQKHHRKQPLAPETENVAVVDVRGERILRYMKPIVIPGEMCLRCHGPRNRLEPEVRQALAEWYPQDRAHGYKAGDLRGAISVSIPVVPAAGDTAR